MKGRVVAKTLVHFVYLSADKCVNGKCNRTFNRILAYQLKDVSYLFSKFPLKIKCNSKMASEQLLISAVFFKVCC